MLLPTYVQLAGVGSITIELDVLYAPSDATLGEAEVISLPMSHIAATGLIAPELTNFTYMLFDPFLQCYNIGV